ncbi:hypothetical protein GH733_015458 [Mirounga leonina]|nr:hypothetical protein GH733_015458 [Mirounga leonina]
MLWVAKYSTFSSSGIIWKIFFVSLHYGKLPVLGKLTSMEKRTLVEKYANHVHNLTEEKEAFSHGREKENKQHRHVVKELQPKQEVQIKEIEEMLYQEGLSEIALSSPSEQITYLLEKLEQIHQPLQREHEKYQEPVQQSEKNLSESRNEDLEKDKTSQNCLERSAEQAAER